MTCAIRLAKTKAQISFAVTLICAFVFAFADCWFSHEVAHIYKHIGFVLCHLCNGKEMTLIIVKKSWESVINSTIILNSNTSVCI